jgi:hypothetical protein
MIGPPENRMTTTESGLQGQAWRAAMLIYASVQFLLLTAIAMLVYPGGAVYEPDASRYLFFRNFFSDLGATVTPSGRRISPHTSCSPSLWARWGWR